MHNVCSILNFFFDLKNYDFFILEEDANIFDRRRFRRLDRQGILQEMALPLHEDVQEETVPFSITFSLFVPPQKFLFTTRLMECVG